MFLLPQRHLLRLIVLSCVVSAPSMGRATTIDEVLAQLGDTLTIHLSEMANSGDGVAVLPFLDQLAQIPCEPLSSRLTNTLSETLTTLRRRYSLNYHIIASIDPRDSRYAIAGRWIPGDNEKLAFSVELGDVHSDAWRILRIARMEANINGLPAIMERCLLRYEAQIKRIQLREPQLVMSRPNFDGSVLGELEAGETVWQLARVVGENWVLINLPPNPLMPINMQDRRGFLNLKIESPRVIARNDFFRDLRAGEVHNLDVLANDHSESSGPLEIVWASSPSDVSISVKEDGRSIRFSTAAESGGSASFRYRVADLGGNEAEATVTIQYLPPRLLAKDDTFQGLHAYERYTLDVLQNDISEEPGPLRIIWISPRQGDEISITADGRAIDFRTEAEKTGNTSFRYRVADNIGNEAEATVSVGYLPPLVSPKLSRCILLMGEAADKGFDAMVEEMKRQEATGECD